MQKPGVDGSHCGEILVCLCQKYGLLISEFTETICKAVCSVRAHRMTLGQDKV